MENTSNALIIAGEILIAVLVLSLLAYIFIQFGSFSSDMHESMTESQITQFNNNFTICANRTNITAQEIATVINYAKQANNDRELSWNDSSEYYVTVYIDNVNVFNDIKYIGSEEEYNNNDKLMQMISSFIKNNNTKFFSCNAVVTKKGGKVETNYNDLDIHYNSETRQVDKIYFHSISEDIINVPNSF